MLPDRDAEVCEVAFKWRNPERALHVIEESVIRNDLHDFPAESEQKLSFMEQTLEAVEALPRAEGRIDTAYLL